MFFFKYFGEFKVCIFRFLKNPLSSLQKATFSWFIEPIPSLREKSGPLLNVDCWEVILGKLENSHDIASVSLVCKQFRSITNRKVHKLRVSDLTAHLLPKLLQRFYLLKSIDCLSKSDEICNDIIHHISQSGLKHFEALQLPTSRKHPREGLRELALNIKGLKKLNISESRSADCCDDDLIALGDWFPTLEEFTINNRYVPYHKKTTDRGLEGLASRLKRLKKISLVGCNITDESLVSISSNCVNLTDFKVYRCDRLTENGVGFLMRHCSRLTSLSLDCFGNSSSNVDYPFSVEKSLPYAKNLENICFGGSFISDGVLHAVAESCPNVIKMDLSTDMGPNNFTIHGLTSLLRACSSLRDVTLNIPWLTDKSMLEISRYIRDLNQLHLSECKDLSIASFFMLMKTCTSLKSLKLSISSDLSYDIDVPRNYQMKELKLDCWGTKVNDQTLVKWLSVCPNLQNLCLRNGYKEDLTNGIAECLRICQKLLYLDVSQLNVSNFMGPNEESKLKLKCIEASDTHINDETLEAIGKRCPDLESLNISDCDLVTNHGLKLMVSKCEKLREIDIRGCLRVSIDLLEFIVNSRPSLKKIIAPRHLTLSQERRNLFLRKGCQVTYY